MASRLALAIDPRSDPGQKCYSTIMFERSMSLSRRSWAKIMRVRFWVSGPGHVSAKNEVLLTGWRSNVTVPSGKQCHPSEL